MLIRDLSDAIKPTPTLRPEESLARAIRLMQARGIPLLPVADAGQLVGIVDEADLIGIVDDSADPRSTTKSLRVGQVMRPVEVIISESEPLESAMRLLRHPASTAALVIARDGRYLGLLHRRDLLAAVSGEPVVPPIAGLATPFGVYLTTGALRAGAGDLALACTGAALMMINLLAVAILYAIGKAIAHFTSVSEVSHLPPSGELALVATLVIYGLQMGIFLMFLRLLPLTGIHAAEHMVVHAIEEGEDLTAAKVREMPRVHPRCGTNLMALLVLIVAAYQFLDTIKMDKATGLFTMVVFMMIILLSWRRLGAGLQRWITTRRPSEKQLARAIMVGESLLTKVQMKPNAHAGALRRMWNSGFPQVVTGFLVVALLVNYLEPIITR